jgi:hypothetical protein
MFYYLTPVANLADIDGRRSNMLKRLLKIGGVGLLGMLALGLVHSMSGPSIAAAGQGSGAGVDTHSDSEVLLQGKASMSIRASVADLAQAKALQNKNRSDLLWARRNGQEYVIQDPATLEAAHALFSRQAEIGVEQKEIGARQRELGEQQREIGRQQAAVGKAQQAVGVRRQTPRAAGEPDQLEPEPGPKGEEQRKLKAEQDQLESRQSALGADQHRLGARQHELDREQQELGRGLAGRFQALVDDAVAKGLAQPAR